MTMTDVAAKLLDFSMPIENYVQELDATVTLFFGSNIAIEVSLWNLGWFRRCDAVFCWPLFTVTKTYSNMVPERLRPLRAANTGRPSHRGFEVTPESMGTSGRDPSAEPLSASQVRRPTGEPLSFLPFSHMAHSSVSTLHFLKPSW